MHFLESIIMQLKREIELRPNDPKVNNLKETVKGGVILKPGFPQIAKRAKTPHLPITFSKNYGLDDGDFIIFFSPNEV
jgi:hypothetical protein